MSTTVNFKGERKKLKFLKKEQTYCQIERYGLKKIRAIVHFKRDRKRYK